MTWDEIGGDDNELRWDGIRSQKKPWHEMRWDEMTWDDDTQLAMRWDGSCELHNIMCKSCSRQDWTHMYTLYHSWHIEDTLRFLITCLQERCPIVVYRHMVAVFCSINVSHIRIFLNKFADYICIKRITVFDLHFTQLHEQLCFLRSCLGSSRPCPALHNPLRSCCPQWEKDLNYGSGCITQKLPVHRGISRIRHCAARRPPARPKPGYNASRVYVCARLRIFSVCAMVQQKCTMRLYLMWICAQAILKQILHSPACRRLPVTWLCGSITRKRRLHCPAWRGSVKYGFCWVAWP